MEITKTWNCPNCQHRNADYIEQTVQPLCGACGEVFDWEEVIDDSEFDALMSDVMEVV
jgi:transcription elongation factor Elf1